MIISKCKHLKEEVFKVKCCSYEEIHTFKK
jgi:hypothetical protein